MDTKSYFTKRSVELCIENVRETGCLESALEQTEPWWW